MRLRLAVARTSYILLSTASILLVSIPLLAQTAPGRLRGQVTDPSGAVIPGATISLKSTGAPAITIKSDGTGNYDIKALPSGAYTVSVSAKGFTSATLPV